MRYAFWLLLSSAASLPAQSRPAPVRTEVAPGVHLFQTAPYGDVGLDGNSVVIISEDGVLVFDSNGTPAAAEAVLAEIRKLTDQPIRYLVHSHWHWDHWYGAEVYRRAFPGLQVISHQRTRALMAGPAIAFNQPGLDSDLPAHLAEVERGLAAARSKGRPAEEVRSLEEHLATDRKFLDQKRAVKHTLATITFTDSLTLHLGSRTVKVLHHDRAITPGDAFLYLPAERLLVTGDLLINPITFALFCYPDGWMRTLDHLASLDAAVLIPGHGAPMRDRVILDATRSLLRREHQLAREARARGRTVDQAKAEILADPAVQALRATLTGGEARRGPAFELYLVDWFVRRVYEELAGPLDDSIPAVP